MNKLVWHWGYDGTVLYVKQIYQTRFLKRYKLKPVIHFYTKDFSNVKKTAENFIKRYEEKI